MTAARQQRGRQTKRDGLKLFAVWVAHNVENKAAGRLGQGVDRVFYLPPM